MKSIAYILSFVILILTAIPCNDNLQDNILQNIEHTHNTSDNPNPHQVPGQCSPFCACTCCQINFSASIPPVLSNLDVIEVGYHAHSPSYSSVELFDFLIPPKS